jgi:GDP-L-fucose synthase
VNVGTGTDVSIKELSEMIATIVGFEGTIVWDSDKPDGTPRKLMDVGRIESFGWKHKIELRDGIASVYEDYKTTVAHA